VRTSATLAIFANELAPIGEFTKTVEAAMIP
jgi:hypothetical protein